MNKSHLTYLASPEWAEELRRELLPWIATVGDLGDDVLEIGPGPGRSTDLLRERVARLTAVEVDQALADGLPPGWPGPTSRSGTATAPTLGCRAAGSRP
jgi:hypothetical protein